MHTFTKTIAFIAFSAVILISFKAGAQWSELGGTNALAANGIIYSVCSDSLGNINVAGQFTNIDGNYYVAKFNGSWSELGGTNALAANGPIAPSAICSDGGGNIYTAGAFTNIDGNYYVAKFNGSTWSELGGTNALTANNFIYTICSDKSGNIYAGGWFSNDSGNYFVAKFNGSSWSELGGNNSLKANNYILALLSDTSGNIYAAGQFTNHSGNSYVAKWNGTNWSELGGNNALAANNQIETICSDAAGNIYAAGLFTNGINDTSGNIYVAKWNGVNWGELGGANGSAFDSQIVSLCNDTAGNIYAAGYMVNTSGKYYVAKYVNQPTGIEQPANPTSSFRLYPNPTAKLVSIVCSENIQDVKIFSQTGDVVQSIENLNCNQHILNLSNLSKGLYYVRVNDEDVLQELVVQ